MLYPYCSHPKIKFFHSIQFVLIPTGGRHWLSIRTNSISMNYILSFYSVCSHTHWWEVEISWSHVNNLMMTWVVMLISIHLMFERFFCNNQSIVDYYLPLLIIYLKCIYLNITICYWIVLVSIWYCSIIRKYVGSNLCTVKFDGLITNMTIICVKIVFCSTPPLMDHILLYAFDL